MTMLISPKKPMFLFCVPVCISIKIFIFKTRISRNHCNCYCKSASRSSGVHGLQPARLLCPWNSPGQNTSEVAIPFPRRSSQPRDRTQVTHIAGRFFTILSHQGSPRILERVAYPFTRGSSWPRKWTRVSCISGRFFTSWTTKKVHNCYCTEVKFAIPNVSLWHED